MTINSAPTRRFAIVCIAVLLGVSAVRAQAPAKKPASLDDELFQGLDDATTVPGLKPKPAASGDRPPTPKPSATAAATAPAPQPVPDPKPKPAVTKPGNALDDELLKSLGGDDPTPPKSSDAGRLGRGKSADPPAEGDAPETPPSGDPFERLTQQIRNVENRLRRVDSGDQTQEMQRKIVDDLEKLIAQIEEEQQQRQRQSQSQSQPKPQSKSQPQPQPGPPQQQPKPSQGDQENDQARDSQEGTRSSTARKPDPGRMRSLLEKAWGSLPERERQDVMQSSVDDFPAKYQFVIEEYFKSLLRRED